MSDHPQGTRFVTHQTQRGHRANRRWLLIAAAIAAACDDRTTMLTTPSPASRIATISVVGVASPVTLGQKIQLSASVAFSDGAQKDATAQVSWHSSDTNVASISSTGLLTIVGAGEADITADLEGVKGTAHLLATRPIAPPVRYDITGVVHESAPTEHIPLADVLVEAVGGPLDGQRTVTDRNGRFTMAGVPEGGFSFRVKKVGYETTRAPIVMLPRDQHVDVGLRPLLATVQEVFEGTINECLGSGTGWREFQFAVHHDGPITSQEWHPPPTFERGICLYRGEELLWGAGCSFLPCLHFPDVRGGFVYRVIVAGNFCTSPVKFRLVFSHPN
jgi:Carboxypeptidase regulatory-like domain/Bacterial Ig-like domain (group 2)